MTPDINRTGKPMQNPLKNGGKPSMWLRRSLISLAENCQGSRSVRQNRPDKYQIDGRLWENRAGRRAADFKSAMSPLFSRGIVALGFSVPVSARSGVPFCRNAGGVSDVR